MTRFLSPSSEYAQLRNKCQLTDENCEEELVLVACEDSCRERAMAREISSFSFEAAFGDDVDEEPPFPPVAYRKKYRGV